jgi:hypothetical protein
VKLVHPDIVGKIDVDPSGSGIRVLRARGWTDVDSAATAAPDPVQVLVDGNTRDQLDRAAADLGIDPGEFATKSDLAAAIVDQD